VDGDAAEEQLEVLPVVSDLELFDDLSVARSDRNVVPIRSDVNATRSSAMLMCTPLPLKTLQAGIAAPTSCLLAELPETETSEHHL
jgi:hypothetical protein